MIRTSSFNHSKLVFILLTKVIIFYIKPIIIDIRGPSFDVFSLVLFFSAYVYVYKTI